MCGEKITGRIERDLYRLGDGIAVDAAADRGEGDAIDVVLYSQLQTRAITTRQQNGIFRRAAVDRPHRVDHVARRQAIALGDFGAARIATAQGPALIQQLGTGRAVDRPIDAATAQ